MKIKKLFLGLIISLLFLRFIDGQSVRSYEDLNDNHYSSNKENSNFRESLNKSNFNSNIKINPTVESTIESEKVRALEPVDLEYYRLQPEDAFSVSIYGEPNTGDIILVDQNGNSSVPHAGIIKTAGKTTAEIEKDLKELFIKKLRLREPRVAVTMKSFRTIKASLVGAIGRPGEIILRPGSTILSLISAGGGAPTDGTADLRRVTLKRVNSNELIPIDLYALLIEGDINQNYLVQDGDQLIVPFETRNKIIVDGAISAPGIYPYKEQMRLIDAISMAHGEVPYYSNFKNIVVIREKRGSVGNYDRIKLDLNRFIRRGDNSQNILLKPGDIIHISRTWFDLNRINIIASTISNALIIKSYLR